LQPTALVTGGSGFLGRRLIRQLAASGYRVRALTRQPGGSEWSEGAQVITADLASAPDQDLIRFVDGGEILFHLAGELHDPSRMRALHVGGTERLLNAAVGRVRRWIQLSSVGVYGPVREGEVAEDSPMRPVGEYETTKAESDERVLRAGQAGLEFVVLRPSIVFAPDMPNRSLRQLVQVIDRGLGVYVGKPGASANYVPADEVIRALMLCATLPQASGRVYNLSDWCTIEQWFEAIAEALGRNTPRLRLPESVVRALASLSSILPAWPLTPARVDALTTRVRYPVRRIRAELNYDAAVSSTTAIKECARVWRNG
jgi:nucleoside-diphosphate-sugar epimerase